MIEIKPVEDGTTCLPLLGDLHLDGNVFVLAATEGEMMVGAGALRLFGEYAVIEGMATISGFEMLEYAIGKALLNFIERRGIFDVVCAREQLQAVLKRLGFRQTSDEPVVQRYYAGQDVYFLNLKGYFTKHC